MSFVSAEVVLDISPKRKFLCRWKVNKNHAMRDGFRKGITKPAYCWEGKNWMTFPLWRKTTQVLFLKCIWFTVTRRLKFVKCLEWRFSIRIFWLYLLALIELGFNTFSLRGLEHWLRKILVKDPTRISFYLLTNRNCFYHTLLSNDRQELCFVTDNGARVPDCFWKNQSATTPNPNYFISSEFMSTITKIQYNKC